jgi:hypothetical protein
MNAPAALPHQRLAGADRYATAVVISQYAFQPQYTGQPFAVTVASGTNFPDALAAGPVAAAQGGPLLLVPNDGVLPATLSAELKRLNPSRVDIAGGTAAVSSTVQSELQVLAGLGPVFRWTGQDRYDTAAQLAGLTGSLGKTVFIATGASFPDELGGSAAAGRLGGALLLTDRLTLPAATVSALTSGKPAKSLDPRGAATPWYHQAGRARRPKCLQRCGGEPDSLRRLAEPIRDRHKTTILDCLGRQCPHVSRRSSLRGLRAHAYLRGREIGT